MERLKLHTIKQEENKFFENGQKDPDIDISREKGLRIMTIMVRGGSKIISDIFLLRPVTTVERSFVTGDVLFLTMIYIRQVG